MQIRLIAGLLLTLAGTSSAFADAPSSTLAIDFQGIETQRGRIMVALFDAEAAWTGGAPVRTSSVDVSAGTSALVTIRGLKPGHYAAKVFHDVDGDGRMGVNPFGVPTEPFAFSNEAKADKSAPSFASAAFDVGPGDTAIHITIR